MNFVQEEVDEESDIASLVRKMKGRRRTNELDESRRVESEIIEKEKKESEKSKLEQGKIIEKGKGKVHKGKGKVDEHPPVKVVKNYPTRGSQKKLMGDAIIDKKE